MWSRTCKVIDLSQKDSVEIKIEVNVKEANGDNPVPRDTPIKKEFPKAPSHPRHNDYPTKKYSPSKYYSLPIPVWDTTPDQVRQTSKRTDYPTAKELKIIRKIQKLEDKLNRIRYSTGYR